MYMNDVYLTCKSYFLFLYNSADVHLYPHDTWLGKMTMYTHILVILVLTVNVAMIKAVKLLLLFN